MTTKKTDSTAAAPIKRLSLLRETVRNLDVRTSVRTGQNIGSCNSLITDTYQPSLSAVHPSQSVSNSCSRTVM